MTKAVKTPSRLAQFGVVAACGTALFSDGYQNGVVGQINTFIRRLYPEEYAKHNYAQLFGSMGFAGTVLGMLIFGYLSDRIGRKAGMILCTVIVFIFAVLSTGAYAGGSTIGMFNMLIAYRFLMGIGIGGEYPSGSVGAAEGSEEEGIPKNAQNGIFALVTNCMIDFGFVIAAFVPLVFFWIFGNDHLRAAWRFSYGFGCIPPLLVFFWRLRMVEPKRYREESMANVVKKPWWLIIKRYWLRFAAISLSWFIYDFITYPYGIYASTVVDKITGGNSSLSVVFGWNTVITLFYMPGCLTGALLVDRIRPKRLMTFGLIAQAIIGFIMSALYAQLSRKIGAFCVVYGIFLSLGEVSAGNCLGLLASKSSPTSFRGLFYGLAAAIGKIGAYAGTWAFPPLIDAFHGDAANTGPFYVGSGLAIISALVIWFGVPEIPVDHMTNEDAEFRAYLEANGFDTSLLGLKEDSENRLAKLIAPSQKHTPSDSETSFSDEKSDVEVQIPKH